MNRFKSGFLAGLLLVTAAGYSDAKEAGFAKLPDTRDIEAKVEELMRAHDIPGLALAIVEGDEVLLSQSFGYRDIEQGLPFTPDTVMYGASITKFVFASYVQQLANEGRVDLDAPIADLLSKPLPDYKDYRDLDGDDRWKQLTLRLLLSHQTGFPNYRFFPPEGGYDPNGKLAFYFQPGERYGYSGEGYYIAQLIVEEFTGLDTEAELQRRFFEPLGMSRTSLVWQDHFRGDFAQGYTIEGVNEGHNMRSKVRAAGSMDTTISDFSKWVGALMSGRLVSQPALKELLQPANEIQSVSMFPTLTAARTDRYNSINLSTSVGSITFTGPQGFAFFKGGHNEKTDNQLLCLVDRNMCVLAFMNTAKGHLVYPELFDYILGDTGMPWAWEYNALNPQ